MKSSFTYLSLSLQTNNYLLNKYLNSETNYNSMRKQYIVVLTANADNISTTKAVVDSLLNQNTDVQYKLVLILSDKDFNTTTEIPFDLYMLGLRQKIQILLCSNVRQTIRSKFSDYNIIEAEHREVAPNWLQNEI